MIWQITAYNGTTWTAPGGLTLVDALDSFYEATNLTEFDIKTIVNLH